MQGASMVYIWKGGLVLLLDWRWATLFPVWEDYMSFVERDI
jgi:hypothetical protein